MEVKLKPGVQRLKGKVNREAVEIYPELEDLVVEPSLEEQILKSEKYGYNEVTVKAVESEELNIIPSREEQVEEGLFDKVTVAGDSNLVAGNIKQGTSIFGVEGTLSNEPVEKYIVRVIDYDGTVLKEEELAEGEVFTMPDEPQHDNLIFQEWSSPVDIIDNKVIAEDQDINIGPIYKTASGATEFDIKLTKITGLNVNLNSITGMTSVDWGDGVTDTNRNHTYNNYGEYTIKVYSVYTLGSNVFGTSSSNNLSAILQRARIGESVTTFSGNIFEYCIGLKSITLHNNLQKMYSAIFENDYSLKAIIFPASLVSFFNEQSASQTGRICSRCSTLEYAILPKGLQRILSSMFDGCYSLKSISIPKSVTSIVSDALNNCYSLKRVAVPKNTTSIGSYALAYTNAEINIPENLISIGSSSFGFSTRLKNVIIPKTVTSISASAFTSVKSLEQISFPEGLTVIPQSVCSNCASLKQVHIPDTVTEIASQSFNACRSLNEIIAPESLTSIKNQAFYNCVSITLYDFSKVKQVPTLENTNAFYGINKNCKIIFSDELYDGVIAATNWSNFADYIYKASEVLV